MLEIGPNLKELLMTITGIVVVGIVVVFAIHDFLLDE